MSTGTKRELGGPDEGEPLHAMMGGKTMMEKPA